MSSAPAAPAPRGTRLLAWSTGFLVATPVWFFVMFGVVSALGISGDSGSAALDYLLTGITLVPGVASLVLGGLAFRADHRWRDLVPPFVLVAFVALVAIPSYLAGDADAWVLLLPVAAAVPTAVAALWPSREPVGTTSPPVGADQSSEDPHHV